jgi:ribosome-interacting GTPase 1
MPTNVTPEYKKAEQSFRQARESRERLVCLKEMLRTIPKHKGTEHLQADIKTRIKQLTDELAAPKKGGNRATSLHTVRPEGAAQVCLIGPPNAGKSSLHARLTGSHTDVGPYPYTTKLPIPGMLRFEDIHIQVIDLPPVCAEFMEPWYVNALQSADAALLIVDLSDPDCTDHVTAICERLAQKKIILQEYWPGLTTQSNGQTARGSFEDKSMEDFEDPFTLRLPTLLVANKSDLSSDPDDVKVLEELLGVRFPTLSVSAKSGEGLESIGALLFRGLEIVRVYTKIPGKSAEKDRPFSVRRGGTVMEVAQLVHKDIAQTLKFARIWGSGVFNGQQVGPDHPVADGDVVELHAN